jgi:hypothetical protein
MMPAMMWKIGLLLVAAIPAAMAQSLRDPTLPPLEAGITTATSAGTATRLDPDATSVIVREGHPYLAVGTRLYAQGDMLGQARIERISETEVWLREAGELRKVQRFKSIERRIAQAPVVKPGCAPVSPVQHRVTKIRKSSRETSTALPPSRAAKANKSGETSKRSGSTLTPPVIAPCVDARP